MTNLLKTTTALSLIALLSACGGGSVQEAQQILDDANIDVDAGDADTDNDGMISVDEAKVALNSLDSETKAKVIGAFSAGGSLATVADSSDKTMLVYLDDTYGDDAMLSAIYGGMRAHYGNTSLNVNHNLTRVSTAEEFFKNAFMTGYSCGGDIDFDACYDTLVVYTVNGEAKISQAVSEMIVRYADNDLDGQVSAEEEAKFLDVVEAIAVNGGFNPSVYNIAKIDPDHIMDFEAAHDLGILGRVGVGMDGLGSESSDNHIVAEAYGDGLWDSSIDVGVFDFGVHSLEVELTGQALANETNFFAMDIFTGDIVGDTQFGAEEERLEITNHSYTLLNSVSVAQAHMELIEEKHSGALHIGAAGNTDGVTAEDQNSLVDAYLNSGSDAMGEWLFVGGYTVEFEFNANGLVSSIAQFGATAGDLGVDNYIMAEGTGVAGSLGTSFAAPKVSAAAAIIWSQLWESTDYTTGQHYSDWATEACGDTVCKTHGKTEITAAGVKNILTSTANKGFAGYDASLHGAGIVNVGAALSPIK